MGKNNANSVRMNRRNKRSARDEDKDLGAKTIGGGKVASEYRREHTCRKGGRESWTHHSRKHANKVATPRSYDASREKTNVWLTPKPG